MRARALAVCMLARRARGAARDDGLAALGVLGGSAAKWTNVVWPIKSRQTNKHTLLFYRYRYGARREGECKRPRRAVKLCWEEYPAERMDAVRRCLFASYKGIITTMGDNNYSHHTASRAAHSRSRRADDAHDRSIPLNDVQRLEEQLKLYARELDGLDEVRTSSMTPATRRTTRLPQFSITVLLYIISESHMVY